MKKDYQRMTEKAKDGSPALITEMIFHELEKLQGQGKRRYYTDSDVLNIVIKYLAELEDKIEQGRLVELPCKAGDTIYWISSNNRDIIEVVVNRIAFVEHDRKILYVAEKGVGEYSIMFVDDIYTTKAEAEAKLRELQGAEQ